MLVLAMIGFLVGVVLGLRFKVVVLVPAMGLALAMAGHWINLLSSDVFRV